SQIVIRDRVRVGDKRGDPLGAEEPVAREPLLTEGVPDIAPEVFREPRRDRHEKPFLLPIDHLRWEVPESRLFQEVLGLSAAELQLAGYPRDELDERRVEVRAAELERVGHRKTVNEREDLIRKDRPELE